MYIFKWFIGGQAPRKALQRNKQRANVRARSRFYRHQMVKMCGCKPKVYTCDEMKILPIKPKPNANSKANSPTISIIDFSKFFNIFS